MTITRRDLFMAAGATTLLSTLKTSPAIAQEIPDASQTPDRAYYFTLLMRIAAPVITSMANNEFRKKFKLELSPIWNPNGNPDVAYLEAFGRLMSGLAPWLALQNDSSSESKFRNTLLPFVNKAYASAVNPKSPDYMLWSGPGQVLVDSAFLTQSFIRAPKVLWDPLSQKTKNNYIKIIKDLRTLNVPASNWMLFAAMNEAFLMSIGEDFDMSRISNAIQAMDAWYIGDGWISDGENFSFNYYNSYVIYPMLMQILDLMIKRNVDYAVDGVLEELYDKNLKRMQRYSEYLERFISADGSFPPFGRSITYRTAAFQPLAWLALHKKLSPKHSEGQIRAALGAVHQKIFSNPDNFSENFLTLGFCGHQPEVADSYSNSGSMYITTESFLILGLPPTDSFWTATAEDWTQKKAFSGKAFVKDSRVTY